MNRLKSLPWHVQGSTHRKVILVALASVVAAACTGQRPDANEQPYEPTFQEKVADCSKIADSSERNRCLYGK
jgi:hypothetical protein